MRLAAYEMDDYIFDLSHQELKMRKIETSGHSTQ